MPRANWHLPPVADAHVDPFAQPIETVGQPIDLTGDRAELRVRFVEIVGREHALEAAGVVCEIKGHPGVCCNVCPVSQHERPTQRGEVCRLARESERIATILAVR